MFRKFLVWLSNTDVYSDLLLKVIPYIRFSLYYTKFRGNVYNEAYKIIKQGDIILTKDSKKLTSILIGGEFGHAALFMGKVLDGANYEVAEMTHHNYTKSDFFDICKESTEIVILRLKQYDAEYAKQMVEYCKTFEDRPYDVGFVLGVRALYCSELIYHADFEGRIKANLDDLRALGCHYISPVGLYEAEGLEVVYDSRKATHRY